MTEGRLRYGSKGSGSVSSLAGVRISRASESEHEESLRLWVGIGAEMHGWPSLGKGKKILMDF